MLDPYHPPGIKHCLNCVIIHVPCTQLKSYWKLSSLLVYLAVASKKSTVFRESWDLHEKICISRLFSQAVSKLCQYLLKRGKKERQGYSMSAASHISMYALILQAIDVG